LEDGPSVIFMLEQREAPSGLGPLC